MSFNQGQPTNDFEKMKQDLDKALKMIGPFLIILFLVIGTYTSFYTVEPDEEAVVIRLGKFTGTNTPGLHFKIPLGVDEVIKVKTKRVLQEEFGFRTASTSRRVTSYRDGKDSVPYYRLAVAWLRFSLCSYLLCSQDGIRC